jgi:Fe-S-cluster formation regulator IscX/YfhJ
MAEMTGQDTDEFLTNLYAKGKEHKEKEMAMNKSGYLAGIGGLNESRMSEKMMQREQQMSVSGSKAGGGLEFEIHAVDGVISGAVDKSQIDSPLKEKNKKTWSELDKYIELLLDSKQTDQSVFVYLNPNPETSNPYDLSVCQYHDRDE